ncbi:carboxypeptidase Q isoform X8 [Alligator mississippiensis]|uniref:carboxypeptidase Q isoform X8 n=1 Tax=Alligator mississippiensis TaxID=8496 RepID=UPI0028775234|nr:carboxypeptidase Q isoform X8 [Alligator mississippiensis]XP_059579844.1 carboxypeptidase Q isoform X8 [Alligator mississippiensis]XP_059579845.1 carboxypeptidase Q isoform X8 [Alligator mississippiensis]
MVLGVPQGSVLIPVLFNIFISDMDTGVRSELAKFLNDTKLWGRASAPEDRLVIQADLDRLQKWADINLMTFNIGKCKVLHFGGKNLQHAYRLDSATLTSTMAERGSGVMTGHKMHMSQQCDVAAGRANQTLACIHRCFSSKSQDVILPLYLALVKPQLEYCIQFWAPEFEKDVEKLERVQRRVMCIIRGQENRPYEERLRAIGLFSLEKCRLREDLVAAYKYIRGVHQDLRECLFTRAAQVMTRCMTNRSKEVILPLKVALVGLQLEYSIQFWVPHFKRDLDNLERIQRRATRMVRRLQAKPYEERSGALDLLSLCKRRLRDDLVATYKFIRGEQHEIGHALFTRAPLGVTRNNGHSLMKNRFRFVVPPNFSKQDSVDWGIALPSSASHSRKEKLF